jgi:uncharacterized protein YbaA (DUF1428 family)
MPYVQGFVIPVPVANKQAFIDMANDFDAMLMEAGATRILECWGDDVPHGQQTDFYRAVDAQEGETVAFSWIEWPDKATCDAAHAAMAERMKDDERFDPAMHPMPFDGKRMIFGSFIPVVTL